ncbi:hypothetical protein F2981_32765 (plasmid) [Sinorhizobium meliloti]|nr:hypothetical protein [Sinorhizobium meliloti]
MEPVLIVALTGWFLVRRVQRSPICTRSSSASIFRTCRPMNHATALRHWNDTRRRASVRPTRPWRQSSGVITEAAARKVNDALVDRELLAVVSGSVYYEDGAPGGKDCLVRVDDQHNLAALPRRSSRSTLAAVPRLLDRRFICASGPGSNDRPTPLSWWARAYDVSGALQAQSEPTPNRDGHTRSISAFRHATDRG